MTKPDQKQPNLSPTPIFDHFLHFFRQLSPDPRALKILKNDQKWPNLSPTPIFDHFLYFFFNFQKIRGPKFWKKLSKMTKFRPNMNFCFFFMILEDFLEFLNFEIFLGPRIFWQLTKNYKKWLKMGLGLKFVQF